MRELAPSPEEDSRVGGGDGGDAARNPRSWAGGAGRRVRERAALGDGSWGRADGESRQPREGRDAGGGRGERPQQAARRARANDGERLLRGLLRGDGCLHGEARDVAGGALAGDRVEVDDER